jgi:hypothetical protein
VPQRRPRRTNRAARDTINPFVLFFTSPARERVTRLLHTWKVGVVSH